MKAIFENDFKSKSFFEESIDISGWKFIDKREYKYFGETNYKGEFEG